jgi:hypothetical protein
VQYQEVQPTFDAAVEALKLFEAEEERQQHTAPAITETPSVDSTDDASESTDASSDFVNVQVTTTATSEALGDMDRALIQSDDPQTKETVHPAVETTLEALLSVLAHPAKLAKACDLSLEGIALLVSNRYVSGRAGGVDDHSGSGSRALESVNHQGARLQPPSLLHRLLEGVAKLSESMVESTQACLIKTMRSIMTSPKCGVHESSMLLAIRSIFHVYLITKSSTVKDAAKTALLDMERLIIGRMEAYEAMTRTQVKRNKQNIASDDAPATTKAEDTSKTFISQYHADSYALFRSLCKMSSKEITEDKQDEVPLGFSFFHLQASASDPMDFEGKILSLELILAAVEFSGEAFCEGDRFVYLVQHYLCVSLLKNCMSNNTQVAYLSQKIFLVLVSPCRARCWVMTGSTTVVQSASNFFFVSAVQI